MLPAKGHPTEVVSAHMKESGFKNVRTPALPARAGTDGDRAIFLGEWVRGKTRMQIYAWMFDDSNRAARWMQAKTASLCPHFKTNGIGWDNRSIHSMAAHANPQREALVWIRGGNGYLLILEAPKGAFTYEITTPIVESTRATT
jgi:hypothetical protein